MRVVHLADTIPSGLCGCGCGKQTDIAERTRQGRGWVRGQPKPALRGHRLTPRLRSDPVERFWSHVRKTESCWLWTSTKNKSGHGTFRFAPDETMKKAHRVSWELANGPIPLGMVVCHNCPSGDNPACVNPAHMFLGDQAENVRDCVRKGRIPLGAKRASSKLTAEIVTRIRALAREGRSSASLAREFGVATATARAIVLRLKWRSVP
jgi:hypothetical protein